MAHRQRTIGHTVLLAAALALLGCRAGDAERAEDGRIPVRVSILLTSTKQVEHYRWAEQTFEAAHPDVDIVIEQFPGSSLKDYEIKLRLSISSGRGPDIINAHENVVAEFARLGLLDPAPPFLEQRVQANSLNDIVRQTAYVDGTCYGVVTDAAWQALYYNKQHFREAGLDPEQPPRTWDDFLAYADRLTVRRPDGTIERAGLSLRKTGFKPGTAEKWLTFLYAAGGEPYNEDGTRSTFNSDAGRAALDFYKAVLFDKNIDAVTLEGDQQGFGQGRASMFIREAHVIRWLQENYPDVEFGVAPIPAKTTSVSFGASYLFVVNEASSHKAVAWQFIDFLMQDEAYARYISVGGIVPATRSVADLPQYRDDPYLRVFLEQPMAPPTPFPRVGRAKDILGAYLERFCYGHLDRDEVLSRAARDVDALLARNRRRTPHAN